MPLPLDQVAVSAPGKLILMGEHAAVYGQPALVAAVDLRLTVTIENRPSEEAGEDRLVELDLPQLGYQGSVPWREIYAATELARGRWRAEFAESQGVAESDLEAPSEAGEPVAAPPSFGVTPAQLVQLTLGETSQRLGEERPTAIFVRIDSELPVGSGFGSSAALAVGVAGAYSHLRHGQLDAEALLEVSLDVERRQHGTPSGIDNAAVLHGGLLWAQRNTNGQLDCTPVAAGPELLQGFRVFHSGTPGESTGAVVREVRRRLEAAPQRFTATMERIGDCTRAFLRSVERNASRTEIAELVRRCGHALEELGVVPEPVRHLIRRIESEGGAAKISGAGSLTGEGAGSILVYHPEPQRIPEWSFLSAWRALPVRFPAPGLQIEPA